MTDRQLWWWRFVGCMALAAGVGLVLSSTYPVIGWFLIVSNAAAFIVGLVGGRMSRAADGRDLERRGTRAKATEPEVETMLDQWPVEEDRLELYTSLAVKTLVLTGVCVVAAIAGVQGVALAGIAVAAVTLLFILDRRYRDHGSRRR